MVGSNVKQVKRGDRRKSLAEARVSKKELQRLFRVPIEAEALRITVEGHLLAEKLAATADRIAKRGGLVGVFERSNGSRRKRFDSAHCRAERGKANPLCSIRHSTSPTSVVRRAEV